MNDFFNGVVDFAGSTVNVTCKGEQARMISDFIIPPDTLTDGDISRCTTNLTIDTREAYRLLLLENDIVIWNGNNQMNLAEKFLSRLCYRLADQSRNGLLFHAAALVYEGKGILIPGDCGAGKSTLTAWMVKKIGCNYLTDELVYIPFGSDSFRAFRRPLHLKFPSRPVLKPVLDVEALNEQIRITSSFSDMISTAILNPPSLYVEDMHPDLIFFPNYCPDSQFVWQPLKKAETGFRLMQSLVNARNLPGYGFSEVSYLARIARGYAYKYDSFTQIEESVETAIKSD